MGVGKSDSLFAPPRVITGKYFRALGENSKQESRQLGKIDNSRGFDRKVK